MRDGRELAGKLRQAAALPTGAGRNALLRGIVDPYIQFVDDSSRCEMTGLRLRDIWRYFRHTWITPYNSIPGRQMCLLVRDRAILPHPVLGIAAVGSSIVQLRPRDKWVGWSPEDFIPMLEGSPSVGWARWLAESLESLIASVYWDDFREEGILSTEDLAAPEEKTISHLRDVAEVSRGAHQLYPHAGEHKSSAGERGDARWEEEARTHLFRSKRASMLAKLLAARKTLTDAGFISPTRQNLSTALSDKGGRRAIRDVLRHVKAAHVGVDILDITVCGAVAPYNPILGGKLVSLLMASPELVLEYRRRYGGACSVIASSMAGKEVRREPNLVLLGTTSLFGVGASQYNRLRVPSEEVGGKSGATIRYELLGKSTGFGSFHFSKETVQEISYFLAQRHESRRVNSIFGEGVNPRLRKIRNGLDEAGLPSDEMLRHGSPRLIYGVPLASNLRDVLIGKAKRPNYILPMSEPQKRTEMIADFWRRRWLSMRIENAAPVAEVARHTLVHPINHGARVVLPK